MTSSTLSFKKNKVRKGLWVRLREVWADFYAPFAVDTQLFAVSIGLCVFGLVVLFSASAQLGAETHDSKLHFVFMQAAYMGLGFFVMWVMAWMKEARLKKIIWGLAWVTLGLLVLTQLVGDTANGSERWLKIGPLRFQTSELAKPAIALLLAGAFSHTSFRRNDAIWIALGMCGVIIALVFKQPNLSITLLLSSCVLSVSFLAGSPSVLYVLGLPAGALLVFEKIKNTPYQWRRIEGWLNPWADPQDVGYNIIQSYYAIVGGGLWGRGFGNSIQKLSYLPFQHTDFIFAVICEELGIIGAVGILMLYAWLTIRGLNIARQADTPFKQLLAFALTWLITMQAVINMSVAIGLFPVTGVTLPLISYGGSSVVVSLGMIGALFALAKPNTLPNNNA
jgi:cell division protein FtsW